MSQACASLCQMYRLIRSLSNVQHVVVQDKRNISSSKQFQPIIQRMSQAFKKSHLSILTISRASSVLKILPPLSIRIRFRLWESSVPLADSATKESRVPSIPLYHRVKLCPCMTYISRQAKIDSLQAPKPRISLQFKVRGYQLLKSLELL